MIRGKAYLECFAEAHAVSENATQPLLRCFCARLHRLHNVLPHEADSLDLQQDRKQKEFGFHCLGSSVRTPSKLCSESAVGAQTGRSRGGSQPGSQTEHSAVCHSEANAFLRLFRGSQFGKRLFGFARSGNRSLHRSTRVNKTLSEVPHGQEGQLCNLGPNDCEPQHH
jgi:hypothetical protein